MNTKPPPSSLRQDLAALPPPFWILVTGTLINRIGHFVIPFLAIYLGQLGFPARVTGLSLAAYGFGGLCANLIGGYLADRIGRKPTMLISCGGATLTMSILALASEPLGFALGAFGCGLMSAIYYPASSALIADLIEERLRIRAYSVQRLAINLGFGIGMMIAGLVAAKSFSLLFIADAGTTAVLGLMILFGLKAPPRRASPGGAGWGPALASMAKNRCFLAVALSSFLIAAVFWQMSSTYGLQVTRSVGLSERSYGFLMALNGLMIVSLELWLTNWTRKLEPIRVMAAGYLLVGAGMGLNAIGASPLIVIVSMVVFTFGEMIALPVSNSYVAGLAPDDMRGRYMGAMGLMWSGAMMVGPMAGLLLFEYSPTLLWLTVFAVCALAALIVRWSTVRQRGDVAMLESGSVP